jgi:hypothetical protein
LAICLDADPPSQRCYPFGTSLSQQDQRKIQSSLLPKFEGYARRWMKNFLEVLTNIRIATGCTSWDDFAPRRIVWAWMDWAEIESGK